MQPGDTYFVSSNPSGITDLSINFPLILGTVVLTLGTVDAAGNYEYAACIFSLTIVDVQPPVITCPNCAPFTANTSILVTWNINQDFFIEDVGGGQRLLNESYPSGSSFNIGKTPVTLFAIDAFNNTANCTFVVTVVTAPPHCRGYCECKLSLDLRGCGGVAFVALLGLLTVIF